MQHKVIIRRSLPTRIRVLLIVGLAALVVAASWLLYASMRATTVSGFERAQLEVETLQQERRELARALRTARTEKERLRDELAFVRRSVDIDQQTCVHLRESLDQLQSEVIDLREQLAFYRGIVSPEVARAGVRVYGLKVYRTEHAQRYRYDLVLIQSVRHERRVSGRVLVQVEGMRAGQTFAVDLASGLANDGRFSLRYFEELSGEFVLPMGFSPRRIRVQLELDAGGDRIEEIFDWSRAIASATTRAPNGTPTP